MAEIKVVDYMPCKSLTAEHNARARQAHYASECARIEALRLAHDANKQGVKSD